jgi:hypothetical protein
VKPGIPAVRPARCFGQTHTSFVSRHAASRSGPVHASISTAFLLRKSDHNALIALQNSGDRDMIYTGKNVAIQVANRLAQAPAIEIQ